MHSVYSIALELPDVETVQAAVCVKSFQHNDEFQALELELDTYSGIANEMGHSAGAMVAAKHPDARAIATKQQLIQQQMRTLHRLATSRQQRLMESMYRHEYFVESAELEQWIREQVQTAASEDYGQDFEHLLVSELSMLLEHQSVVFGCYSKKQTLCRVTTMMI
jgi:hypothetical protein